MVLDILENSDASFSSDDDLENDYLTLEQMEESDSSDEDDSERDLIPENFVINQKATTSQRTDLWKKRNSWFTIFLSCRAVRISLNLEHLLITFRSISQKPITRMRLNIPKCILLRHLAPK
ncbi:PREDICTED: uncharacterized protein LOC108375604 isoform X1 [Rhagoletis zephyria]|nr:PREDICTED: uncharacterized protein LOC108375604 isoform X1 [Rhagoletis zephyria]XP_036335095.1 uncharacterized protein LOC118745652 [Rhagoletis pomonella]XP_036347772.1 uncharacterized protein LOC118757141 [Rhagoletis pomonella]